MNLLLIILLSVELFAAMSKENFDKIMVDLKHEEAQIDKQYFDNGKANLSRTSLEFSNYYKKFSSHVDKAVKSWNRLPNDQKNGPLANQIIPLLKEKSDLQKAMFAEFQKNKNNFAQKKSNVSNDVASTSSQVSFNGEIKSSQLKKVVEQLQHPEIQANLDYFNGQGFNQQKKLSDVSSYYHKYFKRLNLIVNEFNKLPANIRSNAEGDHVNRLLQKANKLALEMKAKWPSFETEAQKREKNQAAIAKNEAQTAKQDREAARKICYDEFKKQLSTPERANIMPLIINGSLPKRASANLIGQVKKVGSEVSEICQTTTFKDVEKICGQFRIPINNDPGVWCSKVKNWQQLTSAQEENMLSQTLGQWENRPLFQENLSSEQKMTFFARKVPNKEGWRHIQSWSDLEFSQEEQTAQLKRFQKMFDEAKTGQKANKETLRPIIKAHEELIREAKAMVGKWPLPRDAGTDYSVDVAKKRHASFKAKGKFIKAWLDRSDWKIHYNALGVPLRRTKPGFMYYAVDGQEACQVISYILTEPHIGGGKYQKAENLEWGYIRFHKCP